MALTDKLTNIADAIREKGGTTALMKLDAMPQAILDLPSGSGGGGVEPPEESLNLTGDCEYRFAYNAWNWFIDAFKDLITSNNITDASYMFYKSNRLTNIPFQLNLNTSSYAICTSIFEDCFYLRSIPKITGVVGNVNRMFLGCWNLREITDESIKDIDWTKHTTATTSYFGDKGNMFSNCYSLRSIPKKLLEYANPNAVYSYTYFYNGFANCSALDELIDLPIPYTATYTSNIFYNTFNNCCRLKNISFKMPDGAPYTMNWKNQTIDLTSSFGYAPNTTTSNYITLYNSGITDEKLVYDDATYAALKNDPDWFTRWIKYSRYNHDSAVATINSLPDTSAYLATEGGTNTIKFRSNAGSLTDGGAISTLTEEEIAVAAAKGWTVTLMGGS